MQRSKNHLLYELYLEESGNEDLFEDTKHLSLGHIASFVKGTYDLPEDISDYTEKDFSLAASIKELEKLDEYDRSALVDAVYKIDEYHQNKK